MPAQPDEPLSPPNDGMELARKNSLFHAKEMVLTAEQEAAQKQKLIDELKPLMDQKVESMIVMQKFTTQKTIKEHEFFVDNNQQLKQQAALIERGREREEKANDFLEEIIPKLESTCESLENQEELTAEKVMNEMVQDG